MRIFGPLICGLLAVLQLSSCSTQKSPPSATIYGFRANRAEFNLGDAARFKFEPLNVTSDRQSRLVILYAKYDRASGKKLGEFFRVSHDAGASLGPEQTPPFVFSSGFRGWALAFTKGGLAAVYASGTRGTRESQNLFYVRSEDDGATWPEPVQINDEQDSVAVGGGGGFSFIQPSENEVDSVWIDRRRGFWLIFFSASHDGGRTWTPDQAVEYDFREAAQLAPELVMGAGGRLLAFWHDGRDRQTLFDIRGSYSDDGGQHWSASQKINDDQEHVWQIVPEAVARGKEIYVVFSDFREPGEEGGNDWNIYFAASADNGQTWKRNIRLNDVQPGWDDLALLTIDDRGTLYCAWRSSRDSILGEVYFTYSTDSGLSWSHSIKINEGTELLFRQPADLVTIAGGKLLCLWLEKRPGWDEYRLAWLEPQTSDLRPQTSDIRPPAPVVERRAPPPISEGETLFADDFSSGSEARWQAPTGAWTVIDGALMGVEPGASAPFSTFARFKEPESYLWRGRFKLDPVHHQMAYLYFRANSTTHRYYVIGNGFQTGISLSVKEDDSPPLVIGSFALDGRPLAQRRFPFRNNRWYEFTLAVRPERVDYFVDGRWMLSYEGRLKLPPGAFGIGGFGSAPTYFDDILVTEQK